MIQDAAPRRAIVPSFRALAKEHALAATRFVNEAGDVGLTNADLTDRLLDWAQVHALVSLACSEVAPPERRACTSRTVDLAASEVQ